MEDQNLSGFARFIFELGQLKRTPRSGWQKLGLKNPESVADHSFRTGAIGFLLGKLEGEDPYKVAGYCLFHDIAETRTLDLDWLAQKYLEKGDYLSSDVVADQTEDLPVELKSAIDELFDNSNKSEKFEQVARDADLLDLLFQAVEIAHRGNPLALKWFNNTLTYLETDSGKQIGDFLNRKEREGDLEDLIGWWEKADPSQAEDNRTDYQ